MVVSRWDFNIDGHRLPVGSGKGTDIVLFGGRREGFGIAVSFSDDSETAFKLSVNCVRFSRDIILIAWRTPFCEC
jgi:hypothetical protein